MCAVVFMLIGLLFGRQLIAMMGAEGEVLSLGLNYFWVTLAGSLFWVMGLAYNMIIRAEGKMITAAWMMGTGLIVNAVLNYIFLGIIGTGVEGAAWGTNIGMFVYSLIGFIYFARNKASFKTKAFSVKIDKKIFTDMIKIGFPSFIMSAMTILQAFVIYNALNNYGTVSDIAFFGVANYIFTFLLTPIMGLMRALQPVIGINFGAGENERVIKSFKVFAIFATLLALPLWLLMMIAPQVVIGAMLTETVMSSSQAIAIRFYMSLIPLLSIVFMGLTLFPSIKKPKPAAIIGMARQVIFYLPVMLIVPRIWGVDSIYYGAFAIDLIITIWIALLVKKEFKKLRIIKKDN